MIHIALNKDFEKLDKESLRRLYDNFDEVAKYRPYNDDKQVTFDDLYDLRVLGIMRTNTHTLRGN